MTRGETAHHDTRAPGPRPAQDGSGSAGAAGGQRLLTPEILTLAAVVVLGSIMTILDATIVNVALPTLGRDFLNSVATVEWIPTIYLLAFASVIPPRGGPLSGSAPAGCGSCRWRCSWPGRWPAGCRSRWAS